MKDFQPPNHSKVLFHIVIYSWAFNNFKVKDFSFPQNKKLYILKDKRNSVNNKMWKEESKYL